MAVILPGKFLYLCNPRTASSATSRTLKEIPGAVKTAHHHVALEHVEDYDGEQVVAAVRNPYDALVSWHLRLPHLSFVEFLRGYDHFPLLGGDPPDLFWHCTGDTHVLRYETLQTDLDAFLTGLELPTVQLFRRNVTKNKTRPWREYYGDAEVEAANGRFGHVADKWGYERLTPTRGRSPS
jgi:hypothetical protein